MNGWTLLDLDAFGTLIVTVVENCVLDLHLHWLSPQKKKKDDFLCCICTVFETSLRYVRNVPSSFICVPFSIEKVVASLGIHDKRMYILKPMKKRKNTRVMCNPCQDLV